MLVPIKPNSYYRCLLDREQTPAIIYVEKLTAEEGASPFISIQGALYVLGPTREFYRSQEGGWLLDPEIDTNFQEITKDQFEVLKEVYSHG